MVFYSEPITVKFEKEPLLEKKPGPPDVFVWRGKSYTIIRVEKEWHTYNKQGKIEKFYSQKGNAPELTPPKGSWGVGRDYYRVKTDTGEVFVIYYDRQPKKSKKGQWILLKKVK
ncbi:MAG: DUF6504 family protein [Candidatus Methanofastidiosia archaeon]|jgi:hypothetical protein